MGILIRAGPLRWLGLSLLLANVVVTTYLTLQAQDYPILRTAIWKGGRDRGPNPFSTSLFSSLWFTWSILARFLAFTPPLPLVEFLRTYGWGRMLSRLPSKLSMNLLAALNYDFYVTTAIAFVTLVLWRARRLSSEGLIWLFGLSLAAFFTLQGYFGNLFEITSEEMRASLLPLAIYVGGMI